MVLCNCQFLSHFQNCCCLSTIYQKVTSVLLKTVINVYTICLTGCLWTSFCMQVSNLLLLRFVDFVSLMLPSKSLWHSFCFFIAICNIWVCVHKVNAVNNYLLEICEGCGELWFVVSTAARVQLTKLRCVIFMRINLCDECYISCNDLQKQLWQSCSVARRPLLYRKEFHLMTNSWTVIQSKYYK